MTVKFEYLLENASVVRETEKAVRVSLAIGDSRRSEAWFPKSQIKIDSDGIWTSGWMLEQKDRELCGTSEAGIAAACYPMGKQVQANN